ncbi:MULTISPECIES: hypothetical protein [Nocardia]|uniref:Uncharacterized protein n=1 Tax=Nocardia nova TaxID=37330 RepID=A0A2T2Z8C3_9NOCA|nr:MULTISPECIES: hypothetical protein [Nocardia]PSR64013.1 hypothetical protein C8259_09205 [Nocardia nova]
MTVAHEFPRFHQSLLNGEISVAHTWKATLHTASYALDPDNHRYQSSLTNEIPNGNGYTTGGLTVANKVLAYDAATDTAWVDCDDPVWDPSTLSNVRYCVISDVNSGSVATNPLILYVDFEANKSSDNAPFKVTINTAGILRLQAQ